MRQHARPNSGFDDRPVGLGHRVMAGLSFVMAAFFVVLVVWLFLVMVLGGQPYADPGMRP